MWETERKIEMWREREREREREKGREPDIQEGERDEEGGRGERERDSWREEEEGREKVGQNGGKEGEKSNPVHTKHGHFHLIREGWHCWIAIHCMFLRDHHFLCPTWSR